jgi:hypothetical protein
MYRRTSVSLVLIASLSIIPFTLSICPHTTARQPPQRDKGDSSFWHEVEQDEKEEIKALEDAFPALYKVKALTGKDDELSKLLLERFYAARKEVRWRQKDWEIGMSAPRIRGDLEFLAEANQELLKSRLELVEKPEEEVAVREDFVKALKKFEKLVKRNLANGKTDAASFDRAHYVLLDAEVQLVKAKRKFKK